tara:strand:- start:5012 stop:5452 length:441 start_codon:yes stop_codon:yes gene_type:complete
MTSFATAGGGIPAATSILAGKRGYHGALGGDNLTNVTGGIRYQGAAGVASDAVNITGAGYWTFGYFAGRGVYTATANVIVTIDGVTALNDTTAANISTEGKAQVGSIFNDTDESTVTRGSVRFNTSLVINIECSTDSNYYYDYYLT